MKRIAPLRLAAAVVALACAALLMGCGSVPMKQFYVLNYLPSTQRERLNPAAYPCIIRLREFDIEEAYNRPQIVYRQSPFELEYYAYRVWAVKPARMITDMAYKHLVTANLASTIIRRFDEGPNPDYEITGIIEAVEEYDSDELWFAHLAIRFNLVRISDGKSLYTRRFDVRKRVYQHKPENVIRELSALMEYMMNQAIHDMDVRFAGIYGSATPPANAAVPADSTIRDAAQEIK
jgi:ABC-type uncharacterized transport system auxiliary subunit